MSCHDETENEANRTHSVRGETTQFISIVYDPLTGCWTREAEGNFPEEEGCTFEFHPAGGSILEPIPPFFGDLGIGEEGAGGFFPEEGRARILFTIFS